MKPVSSPHARRPQAGTPFRQTLCKAAFLALAATGGWSGQLPAAIDTWTGGGASNNWTDTLNWNPTAPASGDSLLYTGTAARTTSNNNYTANALTIAGITFDSTATSYTLTGNAINLSGNIINNAVGTVAVPVTQTINFNMALQGATTFQSAGGSFAFGGNLSGTGPLTVVGTASGTFSLGGPITTTTISGANTYTGATRFTGGNVTLNYGTNNNNKIDSGSALTLGGVNSGVNLTVQGNGTANTVQSVSNTVFDSGYSGITVARTGSVTATLNLGAVTALSGGTVNILPTSLTAATNIITATSNVNGILGGFAIAPTTVTNPTDANWIASTGTAGNPSTLAVFSAYTDNTFTSGTNTRLTAAQTLTSAATFNSLKVTAAGGAAVGTPTTLTFASGTNTVQSGGILFFPSTAGYFAFSGGDITSSAADLDVFITGSGNFLTINSNITGNIGLTVAPVSSNSAGTVFLAGTNTFTGNINVTRSNLGINTTTALPTNNSGTARTITVTSGIASGSTSVAGVLVDNIATAGATLTIDASKYLIQGNGGVTKNTASNGNSLQLLGAHTYTGQTILSYGNIIVDTLANGGVASSIGASSNAASNLIIGTNSGPTGFLQYIGSGGSTDRLFSLNANSAAGSTGLDSSGTGAINFTNTGTIAYGSNNLALTFNLAGTNTGANTFAPVIANDGTGLVKFNKSGAGTWYVTGANSYGGVTTVSAGALVINGTYATATATGAVNVTGGTLLGNGTAPSGLLTVSSGANLAPGATVAANGTTAATPGVLNVGALTLTTTAGAGSNFNILLNNNASTTGAGAGTLYSQLSTNGAVTLGGNLNLTLGNVLVVGDKFFILINSGTNTTSGTFSNITGTSFTSGGDVFTINYTDDSAGGTTGNDISLTVTAVPEPATWVGASLLGIALLGRGLRRRFVRA